MEDYDDEPDLEEQIFHNNVREQIVSTYLQSKSVSNLNVKLYLRT